MRPLRVLDLFCGAGGASMGYAQAGFIVYGVDIAPQPDYPFRFTQTDAMELLTDYLGLRKYDVIHASPPCQRYSAMVSCRPKLAEQYPDLIPEVREKLNLIGMPYVIENVVGAPLRNPIVLCGRSFGLDLYRHRLFESNMVLTEPDHQTHDLPTLDAGRWRPGTIMSVTGHCAPISVAKRAMGIDWMRREELVEAIPPAYTRYIGEQIMQAYRKAAAS